MSFSEQPPDQDASIRLHATPEMPAPNAPPPDARGDTLPDDDIKAEIRRLATLPKLEYERQRDDAARKMKLRPSFLDAEVKAERSRKDSHPRPNHGLREVEAWPEAVTAAELADEIADIIGRHVILPTGADSALALWIMHTWVHENFDYTPRLAVRSPTKRCGKSTLLDLIEKLVRRPLQCASISTSAVFRVVEALRPVTLLLDETDTFLGRNEELRGVLNSGFHRSGSVVRTAEINGEFQARTFSTFAPVAFAGIGSLPSTLEDRSIPIVLQRKSVQDIVLPLRASRPYLDEIASKLARWSTDDASGLDPDPAMPKGMGDRQQDISVPLLSIADRAGGDWPDKARRALVSLFRGRDAEGEGMEASIQLLSDMRDLMQQTDATHLMSAELARKLGEMEGRLWPEFHHGRPISPNQIASLLRGFRVRPENFRKGQVVAKGYRRSQLEEVWARYLPPVYSPG